MTTSIDIQNLCKRRDQLNAQIMAAEKLQGGGGDVTSDVFETKTKSKAGAHKGIPKCQTVKTSLMLPPPTQQDVNGGVGKETKEKKQKECECGGSFTPSNRSKHYKSKRHLAFVSSKEECSE